METDNHLPLWRCEGPEAVKVKSVSSEGSLVLSLNISVILDYEWQPGNRPANGGVAKW